MSTAQIQREKVVWLNCGPGSTLTSLSHDWLQKHQTFQNGTISAWGTVTDQLSAALISPGCISDLSTWEQLIEDEVQGTPSSQQPQYCVFLTHQQSWWSPRRVFLSESCVARPCDRQQDFPDTYRYWQREMLPRWSLLEPGVKWPCCTPWLCKSTFFSRSPSK